MQQQDSQKRARMIAHYLPQYHPIPENDMWWGKGFTEWTNVAKAKPLFRGHHQPNVPADLGFYDLRVPETRFAQAEMAREYGVEAFCYWHYWFAGERLLESPFNEVLRSGEPDFPFCLGWANHTWSGIWCGAPNRILIEQTYPGLKDHKAHFYMLLEAFSDPRYLTVDGKPFFLIFAPTELPEPKRVTDFWRELAVKSGLKGLHIVGVTNDDRWNPNDHGFDAVTISLIKEMIHRTEASSAGRMRKRGYKIKGIRRLVKWADILAEQYRSRPQYIHSYKDMLDSLIVHNALEYEYYPCIIPNWDNTPRSGNRGSVMINSTPELFRKHLKSAISRIAEVPEEHRIIILKSWNEWAEGNYVEPDLRFGKAYLEVIRDEILLEDPASRAASR